MALVVTPNLKLNVPEFDQIPWDEDVNTNWLVLDATIGQFSAIPNLTGIWKNNTEYMFGQSAIDSLDSSIWTCVQFHTSSAAPTTFEQERILYPARWTLTTPGAQFYAEQAAQSAADAAQSAQEAADAAGNVEGGALLRSGGTMTGSLILAHDPATLLEAASKQYVDARVGGSGFLPLAGGTMTGTLRTPRIAYTLQPGAHSFAFGWNGAVINVAVDDIPVGNLATQAYVSGAFLPLTGGSLSGTLYSAGEIQASAIFRIVSSGAFFYSTSDTTYIRMDGGGWDLRYNRATGGLAYIRGGDGLTLFSIGPTGQLTAALGIHADGSIDAGGYLYARGGFIHWGASDRSRMGSDNSTYTDIRMLDAYRWHLNWGNGLLGWQRYDGTQIFSIDVAGSIVCAGNVSALSGGMYMAAGGAGRVIQMAPNWYWDWNSSNGNLFWNTPNGGFFGLRSDSSQIGNDKGPIYGHGGYLDFSDERDKTDIEPLTLGLEAIRKLTPITFIRKINKRHEVGFSAQDVQRTLPTAVQPTGDGTSLGLNTTPIIAAMVVAMEEMAARIERLESGTATH